MAERPVFLPGTTGGRLVLTKTVQFTWHAGMSKAQKRKSIRSLHEAAKQQLGVDKLLEISSKSEEALGVKLSAFNLVLKTRSGTKAVVEAIYQGSKVFALGGPFRDIFSKSSWEAKKDTRLQTSGKLLKFSFGDAEWPLDPPRMFYDWLYLSALYQNWDLAGRMLEYDAFTDIEFNPKKSVSCQAASAALFKAFFERGLLDKVMASKEEFSKTYQEYFGEKGPVQLGLYG